LRVTRITFRIDCRALLFICAKTTPMSEPRTPVSMTGGTMSSKVQGRREAIIGGHWFCILGRDSPSLR